MDDKEEEEEEHNEIKDKKDKQKKVIKEICGCRFNGIKEQIKSNYGSSNTNSLPVGLCR